MKDLKKSITDDFDTTEILDKIERLQGLTKITNGDFNKVMALKDLLSDTALDLECSFRDGTAVTIQHNGMRVLALIDAIYQQLSNLADSYSYLEKNIFGLDMNIPVTPHIVKKGGA